ncbi:MAG: winged helix-turn-helix domain-containing protein [Alphaproteobacteria bacterium]|nr:winged helix-turn-helix domain-containing protein [Alphaproteobacteria bacterium]
MIPKNILLEIEQPVLKRLIEEQVVTLKTMRIDPDEPPDLILHEEGSHVVENHDSISGNPLFFMIPKGAIRLGEIIDKVNYLLSGRGSHIEDENENFDLGAFVFLPADNIITHKGTNTDIRLTDKERLLLRFLVDAKGQGVSRKDLLKAVWGYADDAETHTLETHVYRLRQKLEAYTTESLIKVSDGIYKIEIKKPA